MINVVMGVEPRRTLAATAVAVASGGILEEFNSVHILLCHVVLIYITLDWIEYPVL